MNYNILKKITYIYITLPLFLFSLLWLNIWSSIAYIACLSVALYFILRKEEISSYSNDYLISRKTYVGIVFLSFLWVFLSGIGGYWYQAGGFPVLGNIIPRDFSVRNAVYRDLINYSWPVYYPQQNLTLCYYFGFWLPPALITKFLKLFVTDDIFQIGLNILALWTTLGIAIFLTLVLYITKPKNKFCLVGTLLLPIFFSGLDIIGSFILNTYDSYHLEWWKLSMQYSSLTTLLFWCFNQAVIPWICSLLFFNERKIEHVGLLFICTFFCSPFAGIGLSIIVSIWLLYVFCIKIYNKDNIKKLITHIFSYQNLAMLPFLLLLYCFFSSNTIVQTHKFSFTLWSVSDYLLFCFIEFLLYIILIFKFFKNDIIFISVVLSLLVLCCFDFEGNKDFSIRSSIPAILLLMIYVAKYINSIKIVDYRTLILVILLFIGSITPLHEMRRGYNHFVQTKSIVHREDVFVTMGDKDFHADPFFKQLIHNPQTKFFYQYFSKKLQ